MDCWVNIVCINPWSNGPNGPKDDSTEYNCKIKAIVENILKSIDSFPMACPWTPKPLKNCPKVVDNGDF